VAARPPCAHETPFHGRLRAEEERVDSNRGLGCGERLVVLLHRGVTDHGLCGLSLLTPQALRALPSPPREGSARPSQPGRAASVGRSPRGGECGWRRSRGEVGDSQGLSRSGWFVPRRTRRISHALHRSQISGNVREPCQHGCLDNQRLPAPHAPSSRCPGPACSSPRHRSLARGPG
jgi:hypothetical protein